MNAISQRSPISQGYSAPATQAASANEPIDVVTLNLKPEQMTDKSIQAFIRQMAMEGTPISLNFVDANSSNANNQATETAKQAATEAQGWANQAHVEADRAQQIAEKLKPTVQASAPPTYSEG